MSNVKVPTSSSYQERLIESLQDPIEAAAYLEVMLEREAEDPIPDLLKVVLSNVVAAKERANELSPTAKDLHATLDRNLSESKGAEIYSLIDLLDALGFRLAVVPKEKV